MRPRDIALAVGVAAVWGVNFVVIAVGLEHFPPLLFSALRFGLAAVTALFFVGRPQVRWRWVIAVALALAVTKFSLLFFGIEAGMPAGLSSLVLQSQAVFTTLFAVLLLRERPRRAQLAGLAIAVCGLGVVAARLGPDRPPVAFALVIAAAVAWGLSNVATRRASPPDSLRFMVWVSALGAVPLFALSLIVDGPAVVLSAVRDVTLPAAGAVVYIAFAATLGGFGAWGALIKRYGASTVAPFSMLVPFFGMGSAAIFLGEPVHVADVIGGALVIGGVLLPFVIRPRPPAENRPEPAPAAPIGSAA